MLQSELISARLQPFPPIVQRLPCGFCFKIRVGVFPRHQKFSNHHVKSHSGNKMSAWIAKIFCAIQTFSNGVRFYLFGLLALFVHSFGARLIEHYLWSFFKSFSGVFKSSAGAMIIEQHLDENRADAKYVEFFGPVIHRNFLLLFTFFQKISTTSWPTNLALLEAWEGLIKCRTPMDHSWIYVRTLTANVCLSKYFRQSIRTCRRFLLADYDGFCCPNRLCYFPVQHHLSFMFNLLGFWNKVRVWLEMSFIF